MTQKNILTVQEPRHDTGDSNSAGTEISDLPDTGNFNLVGLLRMVIRYLSSKLEESSQIIEQLKKENLELQVRLNKVNRVFTPKNEKDSEGQREPDEKRKKRGAQPGRKNRTRNIPKDLPKKVIKLDFDTTPCCETCGTSYERAPVFDKISNQIDSAISVFHEVITRLTYKKTCTCPDSPKFKTASQRKTLIKKGILTTATWVHLLIMKYFLAVPIYRYRQSLQPTGFNLSAGTVENGFKKIGLLLQPVYQALVEELRKDPLWNADETRWKVFESIENKSSFLWWLWVFASKQVVLYVIDSSRSAEVIRRTNSDLPRIIAADRFSAYEAVKNESVLIAYCWVHLRRDFINLKSKKVFKNNPAIEKWVDDWLYEIKALFKLNKQRKNCVSEDEYCVSEDEYSRLTVAMWSITEKLRLQKIEDVEYKFQKTILNSFQKRYSGYTIFIDDPRVPMHNNRAEQLLKTGINGRKNYRGNVSQASVNHTQIFLTVIATAKNNNVAPQKWLEDYLNACAQNDSKPLEGESLIFHINKLLNRPV